MSADRHWIKFWPQDWQRDPALRSCGALARGVWMDMLCIMHEGQPYGHLTIGGKPATARQIGTISAVGEKEAERVIAELEDAGVFSRNADGVIFSRRMVRDHAARYETMEKGKRGGNPEIRRGTVAKEDRVRPYRRSDSPRKTERIFAKNDGRCVWCQCELQRENIGRRDFFHVDHRIAICDGGTNDEENLVPACSACNLMRSRQPHPPDANTDTDTNPDTNGHAGPTASRADSDSNVGTLRQQTLEAESESEARSRKKAPPNPPNGGPGDDTDADFVAFWQAYPRKDDKGYARKAWAKALKKATPERIIAGLKHYRFQDDPQMRPMPTTWLNGERWLAATERDERDDDDRVLRAAGVTLEDFQDCQGARPHRLLQ